MNAVAAAHDRRLALEAARELADELTVLTDALRHEHRADHRLRLHDATAHVIGLLTDALSQLADHHDPKAA